MRHVHVVAHDLRLPFILGILRHLIRQHLHACAFAVLVAATVQRDDDEIVKARKMNLSSDDKARLSGVVGSAKESFQMFKATPSLDADPTAKTLLANIPKKLNG